jgi:hypothetical protein
MGFFSNILSGIGKSIKTNVGYVQAGMPKSVGGLISDILTVATPFVKLPVATVAKASPVVSTVAKTVAIKAISNPVKTLAVGAGALVAGSALVTSEKAREGVLQLPSSLVNVGSNIGQVIENPSSETIGQLVKENPLIVGGATVAGALIAGKGIAGAVATFGQTQATKEQTQAIREATGGSGTLPYTQGGETAVGTSEMPPTSPTTTISTGKKRYKRAKVQLSPSVRQSVRVNIVNQNRTSQFNKRYINERILN